MSAGNDDEVTFRKVAGHGSSQVFCHEIPGNVGEKKRHESSWERQLVARVSALGLVGRVPTRKVYLAGLFSGEKFLQDVEKLLGRERLLDVVRASGLNSLLPGAASGDGDDGNS